MNNKDGCASKAVPNDNTIPTDLLCSACDRCRTKKIKCDGNRPCEACTTFYTRGNKELNIARIECVYSLAKRRGPPPKRKSSSWGASGDREKKEPFHKHKRPEELPVEALCLIPGQVSYATAAATTNSNNDAVPTSIFNPLGTMNPVTSNWGFLQNHQTDIPLFDPVSAALQQAFFSSMGSTLGTPATTIAQGQVGGTSVSTGHDTNMTHASSTATQQLADLQQLLQLIAHLQQLQQPPAQQQRFQRPLVQQHPPVEQVHPTSMTATTNFESSLSSSADDGRTPSDEGGRKLSLRSEVEKIRCRVNNLEAENSFLKQRIESLQKKDKEKNNKKRSV